MTAALAADAVSPPTADGALRGGATTVHLGGFVLPLGTLTVGAKPSRITQTHPTLQGAIAAAGRAGGLGRVMARAVAGEVHRNLQCVFKTQRLDDEGSILFFRATTQLGLHTK